VAALAARNPLSRAGKDGDNLLNEFLGRERFLKEESFRVDAPLPS